MAARSVPPHGIGSPPVSPSLDATSEATAAQPTVEFISSGLSVWLDLFRWTASALVVLTHINNRYLIAYRSLPEHERSPAHLVFAFFAGFGREAVIVFFVISGFLVGGSLLRQYRAGAPLAYPAYLTRRLARLWTVLLPTLLLVLLLDLVAIRYFNALGHGIFGEDIFDRLSATSMLCNAAFLQTVACHEYGRDDALWSLFNEFWYYAVWPLFVFAALSPGIWRRVLAGLTGGMILVGLTALQFPTPPLALYFVIWALGALVAATDKPLLSLRPGHALLGFVVYLLAFRILVRGEYLDNRLIEFAANLTTALAFALLLSCMRFTPQLAPPTYARFHVRMASFSYSMYCIHTPVIMLLSCVLMEHFGLGWKMIPRDGWAWACVGVAIFVVVVTSALFARITEDHTHRVRDLLLRVVSPRGHPPG